VGLNLNPRERILAVFERKPRDKIPWNIRPEFWYVYNKAKGTLPAKYANKDIAEICEEWGASWRCYSGYFVESFVKVWYEVDVEFKTRRNGNLITTEIKTPKGVLREVSMLGELGLSSRLVEYPVKSLEDFKPLRYILESVRVEFDWKVYESMKLKIRDRGVLWCFFPRSPLQALFISYMGVERTIRFLFRYKSEVEGLMEDIKASNDKFYEVLAHSPVEILNLGENIDSRITSPRLFEKYCVPYYQERSDYLHKHGKYVHIHVDGWAKPILPLLRETRLDGVEALTVEPVGDITLEDIKKALGDGMVLLDGIPFIFFILEAISLEKFDKFVEKIISMFPDNLVLGISDELPPPSDEGRVKRVSEIIDRTFKR